MESELESLKIKLTQQEAHKNKQQLPTSPTKAAMSSNSSPTSPQPTNSHKTGSEETNGQTEKAARKN